MHNNGLAASPQARCCALYDQINILVILLPMMVMAMPLSLLQTLHLALELLFSLALLGEFLLQVLVGIPSLLISSLLISITSLLVATLIVLVALVVLRTLVTAVCV